MEKYYQPTIDEFHVGFEYESCDDDYNYSDWHKVTCSFENRGPKTEGKSYLSGLISNKQIRVKFLDHDDIVSEGWNHCGHFFYLLGGYSLEFYSDYIEISSGSHVENNSLFNADPIFIGTIRNRSELKVLMKQLNITP